MGYLSRGIEPTGENLRTAMIYGSVLASFLRRRVQLRRASRPLHREDPGALQGLLTFDRLLQGGTGVTQIVPRHGSAWPSPGTTLMQEPMDGAKIDFDLLQAWRGGDDAAGKDLFARHFDSVFRFFSATRWDDAAEDLTQQTFMGLVAGRDKFRGDREFSDLLDS